MSQTSDTEDGRTLGPDTQAEIVAQVQAAKDRGWGQSDLVGWFAARGIDGATYRSAIAGGWVPTAVASSLVEITFTGLPDSPPGPGGNVSVAVPTPDEAAALAHLEHLFGDLPASFEGLVEVAYTSPTAPHKLNHATLHDCGDLEAIAEEVVRRSSVPNQNVYVSAGIRSPNTHTDRRASAADVTHLVAIWADFDEEGAAERARAQVEAWGLPPTHVVQTSARPYQRVQFWWKLEEPTSQLARAGELITNLALLLGGDRSVSNPDRVMRAAGSVAWPLKKGRSLEMTQILTDWVNRREPYTLDEISRVIDAQRKAKTATDVVHLRDALNFNAADPERPTQAQRLAAIDDPGRWHDSVRDWVASQVRRHGTRVEALVEMAPAFRREGYTLQETEQEIRIMAEGAWRRFPSEHPTAPPGADDGSAAPTADGEGDYIDPESGEVIGGPLLDPWAKYIAPPFPAELLPPVLRDFAEYLSVNIGVDHAACAMTALTVCSGALDQSIRLKMRPRGDWVARPRLWTLLVGDPSTKKSPVMSSCMKPLKAVEANHGEAWRRDMAKWKGMPKDQRGDPPPPPTQFVFNNATVESIGDVLHEQGERGSLYETDEFAGWLGQMEKYDGGGKKGGAADRGFWATVFNGGPYTVNRVSKGRQYIQNLCLAFIGAVQPDRLSELVSLTSDGLLQRFIPVMMQESFWPGQVPSDAPAEAYAHLITQLTNVKPSGLRLDEGGYAAAEEFQRYTYELARMTGLGKPFCGFAGKLDGLHGSLAMVLHITGHPDGPFEAMMEGGPVSERTVRAATRIMEEFIIPHGMIFYQSTGGGDWEAIRSIASWVLRSDKSRFTRSDFTAGVDAMRGLKQWDVDQRLSPLVAGGWLDEELVNGVVKAWLIRPHVRKVLAERREIEKQKAAAALAKLQIHLRKDRG